MTEDRLADLESRIAFQEDTLQQLSDLVYRQQQQIDRLDARCRRLLDRMESVEASGTPGDPADEIPPHY